MTRDVNYDTSFMVIWLQEVTMDFGILTNLEPIGWQTRFSCHEENKLAWWSQ